MATPMIFELLGLYLVSVCIAFLAIDDLTRKV